MPKRDKKEIGKEFLEGVLAALPDTEREAVRKALSTEPVLDRLGDGVLMRSDHSYLMNEAAEAKKQAEAATAKAVEAEAGYVKSKDEITEWYRGQLAAGDAAGAGSGAGAGNGAGAAAAAPAGFDASKYLTVDQASKIVAQQAADAARNTIAWTQVANELSFKHFTEYGQPLDLTKLIEFATKTQKPVAAAYVEFSAELRTAKEKKVAEQHEEDLRKKIEAEVRAEKTQLPYTVSTGDSTTLAGLSGAAQKFGVEAAVEAFNKIQSERR